MKKIFFLIAMAIAATSCSSNQEPKKDAPPASILKPKEEVKTVFPKSIGVSAIQTAYTPFPKCDGGECYDVSFTIGISLAGESKSRTIPIAEKTFSGEKDTAKKLPEVLKTLGLHKTILNTAPSEVVVTLQNDEIVEVVKIEHWDGNVFSPQILLWKKK